MVIIINGKKIKKEELTQSTFNPNEMMVSALELTRFMGKIGINPNVKFAFIYSDAETHRKYFEKVAQNDGYNLKYFKSQTEATKWLK